MTRQRTRRPRFLTRENVKLVVVGAMILLLAWTGPTIAHGVHAKFAHNAHKVDGRHAVGSAAGLRKARGKLVAHNRRGKLPARYIPKVRNADRLDGRSSGGYVTEHEYRRRPGTRLIAGGYVTTSGTPHSSFTRLGIWAVRREEAGRYAITIRNSAMSNADEFPLVHLTRSSFVEDGEIGIEGLLHLPPTSTYVIRLVTSDSDGVRRDTAFSFSIYGRGTTQALVTSRPRSGGPTKCIGVC